MSKHLKLLARFKSNPADFRWEELVSLLEHYGFAEVQKKGGSYRCFVSSAGQKLFLHKPHPRNIVKRYALKQIEEKLTNYGVLT